MQFMDAWRRGTSTEHKQSTLRNCLHDVATTLKLRYRRKGVLPWYFVVGLPHSGKTALLQHDADSHWQHIGRYRDNDGGSDSKRGCDWWLADGAVLVDTHGDFALTGENGHTDSWPLFLDQLKRHRKPEAVNAVIIVVSADRLQHDDSEQRQKQARLLRRQLQALQLTSQRRVACFIVINRCDAMNGFTDYFATLSAQERRQIWGVTLTADADMAEIAAQLSTLQSTLYSLLPQRLQSERDAISRRSMMALPIQFDVLRMRCSELCAELFPNAQSQEAPTLRGVYFTASGNHAGNYFVDRLFSDMILADPLPTQLTRQRRFSMPVPRIATITGIAIITLLLISWCTAFIYQLRIIDRTQSLLQQHAPFLRHVDGDNSLSLTQATAALSTLDDATSTAKNDSAWITLLGMRDSSLEEAVISSRQQVLEHQWLPALTDDLLRWLVAHNDGTDEEFDALKAWLMLVDPHHRDIGYLLHWLDGTQAVEISRRGTTKNRLQQLHQYNPQFAVPFANMTAVRPLQQRLASVSPQERIYAQWKVQFNQKILALKPLLGAHADVVFDAREQGVWNMPRLYTADALGTLRFDADMPELMQLQREQWVLGDVALPMNEERRTQLAQALHQRYLSDYVDAWKNLFNAISLHRAEDTTSLLTQLQILSDEATSPLAILLRISEENTKMLPLPQSTIVVGRDRITALSATLTELRGWLNAIYHADDVGNAALQTGSVNSELPSPSRKTLLFSEELPAPVSQWVAMLARTASSSIANTASSSLDSAWRQQVADFCHANIAGHYPFDARASTSVSYSDFVNFFRPGGIEDNFVRSRLNDTVSRDSWNLKPGATVKLSPHTLATLARAHKIRSAFFHGNEASFSYRIAPVRMSANLQRFALNVGSSGFGSSLFEYSHGPRQATQFSWPQDSNTLSAKFTSLRGSTITRTYDGVWGLYRMIDTATQTQATNSNGSSLMLREGPLNIELTMTPTRQQQPAPEASSISPGNPLQRELLSGYDCVMHLR